MSRCCGTCRYNRFDDEYPMSGAFYCANRDGDYYGDYTEYDDGCDDWEGDEEQWLT